jgi:hypothetical protein
LPIAVTRPIDVDGFLKDREQIFSEALDFYAHHPDDWWQMSFAAEAEAIAQREAQRVASIYEDSLGEWLDHPSDETMPGVKLAPRAEICWTEIAERFLRIEREKWKDQALITQITRALRALKWEQAGYGSYNGAKVRIWKRL